VQKIQDLGGNAKMLDFVLQAVRNNQLRRGVDPSIGGGCQEHDRLKGI